MSTPTARRIKRWQDRITCVPGLARDLRGVVRYVSEDERAIVVEVDSNTKYLDPVEGGSDEALSVLFLAHSRTLRPGRSKSPGEIRLALPEKSQGWWWSSFASGRYGGIWHLFRVGDK